MMIENQRQTSRLQRGPVRAAVMRAVIIVTAALVVLPTSVLIAAPSASAATPAPKAPTSKCPTTLGVLCVQAAQSSIAPPPAPRQYDQPTEFKWLLNADTTGSAALLPDGKTPDPSQDALCHPVTPTNLAGNTNYPTGCPWPSVHQLQSSPVVSSGTQADWNPNTPLPLFDGTRGLKDGKYLVSVTSNGYQIGGAHFTVANKSFSGPIIVSLNPWPIPLATIKLKVFSDMASSNGQWDEQTEPGLAGFTGHLADYDGVVSVDYYGNPLCSAYQTNSAGQIMLGVDGKPMVDRQHHWFGSKIVSGPSSGSCMSDANGDISIPNMAPNRYGASVLSPQGTATIATASNGATLPAKTISIDNLSSASGFPRSGTFNLETSTGSALVSCTGRSQTALTGCQGGTGQLATGAKVSPLTVCPVSSNTTPNIPCWVQTTTLEGNHDFDVWATGNDQGIDTELVVGGEPVPFVHFGFTLAGCMTDSTKSIDAVNFQSAAACHANFPLPPNSTTVPTGAIKGKIMGANSYFPGLGGLPGTQGNVGVAGYKYEREVKNGWVALSDLSNNDKTEYGAPANPDGTFQINGVPNGTYSLSIWDQQQDYIFDSVNVDVVGGQIVDLGVMPVLPWFTRINGKVCIDKNGNGRCDPGEPGVPQFVVQNLDRTNNTYEQGQNLSKTDANGNYEFTEGYPLGSMNIIQAFNTRWKTTGVTWQACNDPQEHTTLTGAVDVSYQPIISQCGRLDWAVQPYTPSTGDNGGIVATVLNDSMRSKYLGRTQVQFDHFTGIPGVMTELFTPAKDADGNYLKNTDGSYQTTGPTNGYTPADRTVGGNPNAYITEHYGRPTGCVAQDANGHVIQGTVDANGKVSGPLAGNQTVTDFLPGIKKDNSQACLETPATGVAFGLGSDNLPNDPTSPGCLATPNDPVACPVHGVQTVDGNFTLTPPKPGDYLAKVTVPGDTVLPQVDGTDRPLYKVVTEADINHFGGTSGTGLLAYDATKPGGSVPQFIPQGADLTHVYDNGGKVVDTKGGPALDWPPRATAPLNQQPAAIATPGAESPSTYIENPGTYSPAPDPQCAGATFTVNATDPSFLANGGSPLQGLDRNFCDVHLLHVGAGQSVAPNFYLYTDVPLPTMFQVQNFDDTNISTAKKQTQFGDAAPIPNSPVGVYDWAGNQVGRINTDPNGIAEVLLPSTDVANCATPAGICQNTYRFVGNDPGTPDNPNPNFNPQFQTITATFQALPGVFEPADTAPTRSAIQFINSGQKFTGAATCWTTQTGVPQLFSVDKPFTTESGPTHIVIKGVGFGTLQGKGALLLKGPGGIAVTIDSWNDSEIHATIGSGGAGGAYQLTVRNDSLQTTLTGITFHIVRGSYTPTILEVKPNAPEPSNSGWAKARVFPSIQEAIERAAGYQLTQQANNTLAYQNKEKPLDNAVVVVYPNTPTTFSPLSTWYEPIILHSAVHVQGVGPGGIIPAAAPGNPTPGTDTAVLGTVLDNRYFFALLDTVNTPPQTIDWAIASQDAKAQHSIDVWRTIATALYPNTPAADNKTLTEGQVATVLAQNGQPEYTAAAHPQLDGVSITGGITENFPTNVNEFTGQKTGPAPAPDVTQGGAVFVNGHADWTQITNDVIQGNQGSYGAVRIGTPQLQGQHNWHVEVAHTQLVANGGNNLGGGLAIFNDSGGYNVHDNLICGNQSAEYGGGMSQYGLSIAPVSFTGASIQKGNQPELTVGGTATPFAASDIGASVTGPDLTNATITAIRAPNKVRLSRGSYSGKTVNGTYAFEFIPTTAKLQTSHNTLDHNQIYMNQAIDEGGGIAIAGELPSDSTKPSKGAGPVNITSNKMSVNMANDDGGAIRFLMAGNFPMRVDNNVITDNVSAHEGGGISIDDTPQVTIINNTISKNLTTATAATSNGTAAPAGISTAQNSVQLQKTLPAGSPLFSDPVIANNILTDNRAGSWTPSGVVGIGLPGDTTPINIWDIGSMDNVGLLSPVGSVLSTQPGAAGGEGYNNPGGSGNVVATDTFTPDPSFVGAFNLEISVQPLRTYFRFRPTAIVNVSLPPDGVGNYDILDGSPAATIGVTSAATQPPFLAASVVPPGVDIAGKTRAITPGHVDAGSYQITGP